MSEGQEEQMLEGLAQILGLDAADRERAELEVSASTVEAEETLRQAIDKTEEETGKVAYLNNDGEIYVNLTLVESVLSGIAKGFIPEVMEYAMKNAMGLLEGDKDEYAEGRLSAVNAVMTLFGAVVSLGKERADS